MTVEIGDALSATIFITDDVGTPIEGLVPTTLVSANPVGDPFTVTYEDIGNGGYFVEADEAASIAGVYTLIVDANDLVDPESTQKFAVTWGVATESVVITGVQRVQYVAVPHPADPDGTHDSRYLRLVDGEAALDGLIDDKADLAYVDMQLALKADQTSLDQVIEDLSEIMVDTTDMATQTWVTSQLSAYAVYADVNTALSVEAFVRTTADATKVDDFTQYYVATVDLGNGADVITTAEQAVDFVLPEAMTLHSVVLYPSPDGTITLNTARATALSASFSDVDASAPLAVTSGIANPGLTGWTTSFGQFDRIRTTVAINASAITRLLVAYRFTKDRA